MENCAHCGLVVPGSAKFASELAFCCAGCRTVYGILKRSGLEGYYELRESLGWKPGGRNERAPDDLERVYGYLDSAPLSDDHSDGERVFFLEGVHCTACLWLIERLPEFCTEVTSARLNLHDSTVRIVRSADGKWSRVAALLHQLGYPPHWVTDAEEGRRLKTLEERALLIRIGVAGACAGNIMLLAVAIYAGATGWWADTFHAWSGILALPALFFSATPLYRSAWGAMRSRRLSVDVPIVLAVLSGAVVSYWSLFFGKSDSVYLDSVVALIFLLLSTRYFLKRVQGHQTMTSHLMRYLAPISARKFDVERNEYAMVASVSLRSGDRIRVDRNEVIPADGKLLTRDASVQEAVLTGESVPRVARVGQTVFSGSVLLSEPVEVEVQASGALTRIGKLIRSIEMGAYSKPAIVSLADRVGRAFLTAVMIASAVLVVTHWGVNPVDGIQRALTLLIVTCPCAFALATPLAFSLSLGRAAGEGILIKDAETLERLAKVRNIFLDKTGTLTYGNFEVFGWNWMGRFSKEEIRRAVRALESRSAHPIARALVADLGGSSNGVDPVVGEFSEVLGVGVSGRVDGQLYEVRGNGPGMIGIWRNGELQAEVRVGDQIRPEARVLVSELKSAGLEVGVLSGDREKTVRSVALEVGISEGRIGFELSPEQKAEIIRASKDTLMLGDGANDAAAFAVADVGMAVQGSLEAGMRSADVYLTARGLRPVIRAVEISRETMRVVRRGLLFTVLYNGTAGTLAWFGYMSPLLAAVLMPLSALTVFLLVQAGTHELRMDSSRRLAWRS